MKERYRKDMNSIQEYQVLQYGITFFCPSEALKQVEVVPTTPFVALPFNFYVFYRHQEGLGCPPMLRTGLFSNDAIVFLLKHHFDFNRSFAKGLSYLSLADEKKCMEELDPMPVDRIPPETLAKFERSEER